MSTYYQLELQTPTGEGSDSVEDIVSVEASCNFNTIGSAVVTMEDRVRKIPFQRDTRVHLWRIVEGVTRHRFGNTVWFCRKIVRQKSLQQVQIHLVSAVDLIRRRIVAYKTDTAYGDKTMDAFDISDPNDPRLASIAIILAYMRENMGALAVEPVTPFGYDPERDLSDYLDILDFSGLNVQQEKQGGWTSLFDTIQEVARVSEEEGSPLYFDIRPNQLSSKLQFILWNNYAGIKRGKQSSNPLIFSEKMDNLTDLEVTDDYTEEVTVCYVLGEGDGTDRQFVEVQNVAALRAGPFNRIESVLTLGGEIGDEVVMEYEGRSFLQSKRPRRLVTGRLIDSPTVVFGRDYDYGYQVVVDDGSDQYDALVNNLHTSFTDGEESLEIRLSGETFL